MLELRRDASVARELTTRFTERNARVLMKRWSTCHTRNPLLGPLCRSCGGDRDPFGTGEADAASIMAECRRDGPNQSERSLLRRTRS